LVTDQGDMNARIETQPARLLLPRGPPAGAADHRVPADTAHPRRWPQLPAAAWIGAFPGPPRRRLRPGAAAALAGARRRDTAAVPVGGPVAALPLDLPRRASGGVPVRDQGGGGEGQRGDGAAVVG